MQVADWCAMFMEIECAVGVFFNHIKIMLISDCSETSSEPNFS